MEAPFNATKGLYTLPLDTTTVLPTATQKVLQESRGTHKAYTLNTYTIPAVPQMIKFLHATAGYPVIGSWLKAIKKNHYMSWPGLCAATVKKHLQDSPITSKGHMKMVRQNRHPKTDTPTVANADPSTNTITPLILNCNRNRLKSGYGCYTWKVRVEYIIPNICAIENNNDIYS